MRVVVFRPGALGDALLVFPALAALRRARPEAEVTLVARAEVLPLARAAGLARATYPFDLPAWGRLWGGAPATDPLVRAALGGADAAVAWLRDAEGEVARGLGTLGVGRAIVAPGRPPDGEGHVARYLWRTLEPLGLPAAPATRAGLARGMAPLAATAEGRRRADEAWGALALAGRRVVALHPGSGGAEKRWPAAAYAALTARLRAAGYVPLLIEGPADGAPVAEVLAALAGVEATAKAGTDVGMGEPPVARGLPVEALGALLARCRACAGNDSGVAHLAALAGTPTLALFGPSDPGVWAPVGRAVRVVRAPARGGARRMEGLEVWRVWAALRRLLTDRGDMAGDPAG